MFEQGLRATGSVRATDASGARLLRADAGAPIERARQRVRDAIEARVPDARAAGVLTALAVGDQAAIERNDWDVFRATGIAHLVSISGLHVTMLAWLAAALIGRAWRLSPRAMMWLPAPTAARWGGLAAAVAYALLAGWGVPAQRTVWMLATAAGLAQLGLRWPWPLVLLVVAAVVAAIDPWALLQPGFWLSFAAVGLLLVASREVPARALGAGAALRAALAHGVRTQVVATLGLAPLTLMFFQQVSLVGFVANLIAIPLVTLVVTPLALAGVLLPPLWSLGAAVVQGLTAVLQTMAALPAAVWTAAAAPWWLQVAALGGAVLLLSPLPSRLRWLALPLMLPLFFPPLDRPAEGGVQVTVADVGQGSAVLVRTRAPRAAARHRRPVLRRQRCRHTRAGAAAARARRAAPGPADAQPPRQRPHRRRARPCWPRSTSPRCRARSKPRTRCWPRRGRTGAARPANRGAGTASSSASCIRRRPTTRAPTRGPTR